ncbi:SEP-domain-containing protein [Calocera cornea HHB12733]|uniref:SEP-domain-containing protein n=1 Tax=Calocera cornea HHB12733 TaxID=1353952 RepID=A0A165D9C6_9BASI|nr:SEP-domain-containing protein [Calocera cornea HHB12733]
MSTLGGDKPSEDLPPEWAARAAGSGNPRVGRIGQSSTSQPSAPSGGRRIATLSDMGGAASNPARIARMPDDDDDDEGPDEPENWFAGGDRSGLAVQAPDSARQRRGADRIIGDIIRKAADHSSRSGASLSAPGEPQEARSTTFHGSGYTLGSDEVESQFVPDPTGAASTESEDEFEAQRVVRELNFWHEGFSVDDGPLYRYDDPANAQLLEQINAGHAPPQALNVRVGQPVEVRVARRTDEHYKPPAPRPFGGSGHRLGAPTPSVAGADAPTAGSILMPGTFPAIDSSSAATSRPNAPATAAAAPRSFEVNMDEPNTSIQVRLADGTRLVCRMNHTHTVGDIRNFVNASRPENAARAYNIQTTFPPKVLEDESQTIKDAGLLNSVVVQRWVD